MRIGKDFLILLLFFCVLAAWADWLKLLAVSSFDSQICATHWLSRLLSIAFVYAFFGVDVVEQQKNKLESGKRTLFHSFNSTVRAFECFVDAILFAILYLSLFKQNIGARSLQ